MGEINNGVFRWYCHSNSILFCFVFFLLSCNGNKQNEVKNDNIQELLEIESTSFSIADTITEEENRVSEIKQKDTISEEWVRKLIFLKKKGLIPYDFKHNNAVFYKSYNTNDISYNLLKIKYSTTIGEKYMQDPYINFIYVKSGEELLAYNVLYSIEEEDVDFAFNIDENVFYEQYDSSTGWKKYFSFLKSQSKFISTDEMDEVEEIIQSSINLQKLTYRTSVDNETKKFKTVN